MNIVVTGANGYIGHNLVKKLIDEGNHVVACDINNDKIDKRAIYKNINIFDSKIDFYNEFDCPDALIHLAWRDGFKHDSEKHILDLPYHYLFLKKMIESGTTNISVLGTMHEIGYFEGKINDNTPCNPLSNYGIAKNTLRQLLFALKSKSNFDLKWLRCFYIYGDDKNNHSIFTKLIEAEKSGKEEFPFTTGKSQYDFTNIDDLIEMIFSCIIQNEINGIINCCSGIPISLKDKVEKFIEDNNLKIKLAYGVYPDRPYDSKIIYGDNMKIEQIMQNKNNIRKKSY